MTRPDQVYSFLADYCHLAPSGGTGNLEELGAAQAPSNARMVIEIRRPSHLANRGTPCFHARFVSKGVMKTVPSRAGKSRVSLVLGWLSRKMRSSPSEIVTIGASRTMCLMLSWCGPM